MKRNRGADEVLRLIGNEYAKARTPWIVGFSGGKDSSALLKLVVRAMLLADDQFRPVHVVYCDTGVEIPVISALVHATLRRLRAEAKRLALPLHTHVARPSIDDRYFVKVIGRGYPPPTNKFRWCTDRLRIDPVQRVLHGLKLESPVVVLGTRLGESPARDKTLSKYRIGRSHFFRQSRRTYEIFAPLLYADVAQVWQVLSDQQSPNFIDGEELRHLYEGAGGDCPVIREPGASPCAQGRFGCWTCTVINKDKAVTNLVAQGRTQLRPLLNFRNWLSTFRHDPANRCRTRRNGAPGPGPLTLRARRTIFKRLVATERSSQLSLITPQEARRIRELWTLDSRDPAYVEH